jgi:uncharacterized protein (UPF0254 family)
MIKPNDYSDLMDCMTECFKETDKVSAKMLAEKMKQKTSRPFTYQNIAYLYTLLGFIATPVDNTAERFLMRNDELINKIKADAERYREVAKVGAQINLSASQYSRRDHEFIYSKVSPQ